MLPDGFSGAHSPNFTWQEDTLYPSDSDPAQDSETERIPSTLRLRVKRRRSSGNWSNSRKISVKEAILAHNKSSGSLLHVAVGNRLASCARVDSEALLKTPTAKENRMNPMQCPNAPRKARGPVRRSLPIRNLRRFMAPAAVLDAADAVHSAPPS